MKAIVLSFLLVALPTGEVRAQSSGPDSEPVLTVSGSAQVRVTPDLATVRLGVVQQANTAGAAQDDVNGVAGRMLVPLARQASRSVTFRHLVSP